MMSTTIGRVLKVCLGTWLALAAGCAPTGAVLQARSSVAGPVPIDAPPQASLVSPGSDDPEAVALSSSIRKVTVYSDRAQVTREATVKLTTGPTVYVFKQLPGWVDESSVRASSSGGRILDVRVTRSYLAQATERGYREAEDEARALENRMSALDDELKVLDAQAKQVEDIKAFSLDKLNKDVVAGNVGVNTYASVVEFISKTLRETAGSRRAVRFERDKLTPEIAAKKRRLDDLHGLTQLVGSPGTELEFAL